jgi:hypothetical protein
LCGSLCWPDWYITINEAEQEGQPITDFQSWWITDIALCHDCIASRLLPALKDLTGIKPLTEEEHTEQHMRDLGYSDYRYPTREPENE